MKSLRTVLFWIHLVAGCLAGVVILIMSVTGVALTYQRQLQWWADTRHYQAAPPAGVERLPASRLLAAAQLVDPATPATTVTLRADVQAPAAVALGTRTIYLNPYTAQVYGEGTGPGLRSFFAQMVSWHRYLAMTGDSRPTGRALTGASNLLFLFLVLSGIYLWWPRTLTRAQFRNILWFRGGLRPKARNFNWHNVLGFWSAIPLAVVVYSGVVISYPWASNMVYRVVGEEPPAPAAGRAGGPGPAGGAAGQAGRGRGEARGEGRGAGGERREPLRGAAGRPTQSNLTPDATSAAAIPRRETSTTGADLDRVFLGAMQFEPAWTILGARVPTGAGGTTTVTVDRGDGGQPQLRGTLTLDVASGAVRAWDGFSTQTTGRRARSFLRFAHTGEFFGLPGQTIAGVVSAAGAVLVYTGLALSLRRFREWRSRRRSVVTTSVAA